MLETYQDVDGVHVPEVLVPYMGGLTFLPFVRDSRMAPSVDRPLGSAGTATNGEKEADNPVNIPTSAPAPVVALATVTTPGVAVPSVDSSAGATAPLTPEVQAIVDKITIKGDEIRALKAAKVGVDGSTSLIHHCCIFYQSAFSGSKGVCLGTSRPVERAQG